MLKKQDKKDFCCAYGYRHLMNLGRHTKVLGG
jgi:hypothetical protein